MAQDPPTYRRLIARRAATFDAAADAWPLVQVHPTQRCNFACRHCCSRSGPRATDRLPVDVLEAGIVDAASLGYRGVVVSGGEPLLYRPLVHLLIAARSVGMTTAVVTNGTMLSSERLDELRPVVDVLAISIDGTPASHDALRGTGAHAAMCRHLPTLAVSGVPFGFVTTLTSSTSSPSSKSLDLESVVALAGDVGARFVQVQPLVPDGRARELQMHAPGTAELVAAHAEVLRLDAAAGALDVALDAASRRQVLDHPLFGDAPARARAHDLDPDLELTALAPVLVVDAHGTVRPVAHDLPDRLALGSMLDAPLTELRARRRRSGGSGLLAAARAARASLAAPDGPVLVDWPRAVAARAGTAVPVAIGRGAGRRGDDRV